MNKPLDKPPIAARCIICGESFATRGTPGPKVCSNCKSAVMYMRKQIKDNKAIINT